MHGLGEVNEILSDDEDGGPKAGDREGERPDRPRTQYRESQRSEGARAPGFRTVGVGRDHDPGEGGRSEERDPSIGERSGPPLERPQRGASDEAERPADGEAAIVEPDDRSSLRARVIGRDQAERGSEEERRPHAAHEPEGGEGLPVRGEGRGDPGNSEEGDPGEGDSPRTVSRARQAGGELEERHPDEEDSEDHPELGGGSMEGGPDEG